MNTVDSEVGKGRTFRIFVPTAGQVPEITHAAAQARVDDGQSSNDPAR